MTQQQGSLIRQQMTYHPPALTPTFLRRSSRRELTD